MWKEGVCLGIVFLCGMGLFNFINKKKWYDTLSLPFPWLEIVHGLLWSLIFFVNGWNVSSGLFCFMTTALMLLSLVDLKTYEIPPSLNGLILSCAVLHACINLDQWKNWLLGFFMVSLPLYLLFLLSGGKAIGGGDIKLMAVCGVMIGWKNILLALFLGCILGSVFHLLRMKLLGADRVLAMGPYLAAGIYLSMLFGERWIHWYLSFL